MSARATTRYGRYEIVGPLASGGMADLHLARASGPSGFETLAVVKRIRPHLASSPEFVRLFLGEARLAAGLRHPNVVSVYDAGQEEGEYYFVMEFVHGRDLRALIDAGKTRQRPLSFDEAVTIAVGVCSGLHHAHEATDGERRPLGIVHRDISPSNVLVSFDGAVKLADFGIAKPTTHPSEPGTNTLRGKLSYMSPEQSLGMSLDRRSDLYSLSVVLYELTTGARPFGRAASEFLEVKQSLELTPMAPSARRPDYPRELEQIVMRGLDRRRERRYATAREMQLELEAFARRGRLALSPLTLERMMEELFAADLDAWQSAQRRGSSLAQHVTDTHSLDARTAEDAPTTSLPPAPGAAREAAPPVTNPEAPSREPAWRSRGAILTAAALLGVAVVAVLTLVLTRASGNAVSAETTAATQLPAQASAQLPAQASAQLPAASAPLPAASAPPTASALPTASAPPTALASPAHESRASSSALEPSAREPLPRARLRVHPPKHVAKRSRSSTWDPDAAVLPH